jgi:hypothetical protein
MTALPPGKYPFLNSEYDLSELAMVEAPHDLELLLKSEAARSGIEILRDQPFDLACDTEQFGKVRFFVWYPSGQDRLHFLVPKTSAQGRA